MKKRRRVDNERDSGILFLPSPCLISLSLLFFYFKRADGRVSLGLKGNKRRNRVAKKECRLIPVRGKLRFSVIFSLFKKYFPSLSGMQIHHDMLYRRGRFKSNSYSMSLCVCVNMCKTTRNANAFSWRVIVWVCVNDCQLNASLVLDIHLSTYK